MASNMTVTSGEVEVFDVTLSLDTIAYADGDVLVVPQKVPGFFREAGKARKVPFITLLDESDQGQALDLLFLNADATLGTINAAVSISDADARKILAAVSIETTDYVDLVNSQIATKTGLGLVLKAAAGEADLWVAAISRGTGTYAASGIRLKIGLI